MTKRTTQWRLSARAESDLKRIWLQSAAQWSPQQADKYLLAVFQTLDLLTLAPRSGRLATDRRQRLWIKPCLAHTIWYRIDGERIVVVIRILHGRMEPTRHL